MDAPWFDTLHAWTTTFDEFAPGVIEGLYVVGSIALDDWQPGSSDIDIVAVTAEPADDETSGSLRAAHAAFAADHAGSDGKVDGPFVAWGDLTVAPQALARPWVLDGVYHHDAECFELNPVTWYTLATYGVRLRGPSTDEIPIPTDADERIRFVVDNARDYWVGVLGELRGALTELSADATLPSSVPVWCLLGACRMLYTASTGDVTSKSASGRWAADQLAEPHRATCLEVVHLRAEDERPVSRGLLQATADAMAEVLRRVVGSTPRTR